MGLKYSTVWDLTALWTTPSEVVRLHCVLPALEGCLFCTAIAKQPVNNAVTIKYIYYQALL